MANQEPDISKMSIIVRDPNAVSVQEKGGKDLWLKDRMNEDIPEYYDKLKSSLMAHLEPHTDKDGIVKLPGVKVMELVARMLGLDSAAGGVNIFQQINAGNTTNNTASAASLESLIRRSEERDKVPVIDAEFTDVK